MSKTISLTKAIAHYQSADEILYQQVKWARSQPQPIVLPKAKPENQYYATLVNIIIGQQISSKAAAAVYQRMQREDILEPKKILKLSETKLQQYGLSRQKVRYIRELAINWGTMATTTFATADDELVQQELTAQYGLGVWSAEMFLIFGLARPDVFSIGDLGLRKRITDIYGIPENDHTAILSISDRWRPHRTVATLTFWYGIDTVPVLL